MRSFDLILTDAEGVEVLNALTNQIVKHLYEKKGADVESKKSLERKIEFLKQIEDKIKYHTED